MTSNWYRVDRRTHFPLYAATAFRFRQRRPSTIRSVTRSSTSEEGTLEPQEGAGESATKASPLVSLSDLFALLSLWSRTLEREEK